MRAGRVLSVLLLIGLALKISIGDASAPAATPTDDTKQTVTLYSPDAEHPWNRLHAHFFVRRTERGNVVGQDTVDPLLWHDTTHLLEGKSHSQALKLLEELNAGGWKLCREPVKRAVLQHDLWRVWDWATYAGNEDRFSRERQALQERLAKSIRLLSLSQEQIEELPDTYQLALQSRQFPIAPHPANAENAHQPYLPEDLFDLEGSWVSVGWSSHQPPAAFHTNSLEGRSVFLVFLRLPDGRRATLDYLEKLNMFPKPLVLEKDPFVTRFPGSKNAKRVRGNLFRINSELPQFPIGTQTALVRKMIVIDERGQPVATPIIEKIQFRIYDRDRQSREETEGAKRFFELRYRRGELFAGKAGGLTSASPEDKFFKHFFAHGERSQFQSGPTERRCLDCHQGNGIHALNTFQFGNAPINAPPRKLFAVSPDDVSESTANWKRKRYEWGLLQGVWQATNP